MKKCIYLMALAAATFFTTACSDDDVNDIQNIPDSQKEMISFSLSDGTGQTRAGFTEANTRILMRIESEDRHSTTPGASKFTRALATASKDEMDHNTPEATAKAYSTVNTSEDPRYWDDAYGRFSQLSVYAIAIANKNDASLLPLNMMYDAAGEKSTVANTNWGSSSGSDHIADNTISFTVETSAPNCAKIANQDLVYSNNIRSGGTDGVYRYNFSTNNYPDPTGETTHTGGRMIFAQNGIEPSAQPTSAVGKFDKGHLVFNHALSRITVELKEGEGFNTSSNEDFKFSNSGNIKLLGMNTTGTLDVKTGTWTPGTATAIDKMAPITYTSGNMQDAIPTTAACTYMAQMLPDYIFKDGNTTNVMEFEIDNNTYYVTQDMLYDALFAVETNKSEDYGYDDAASKFTMKQGKNYKFTITVKKAGIAAITAKLAEWVDVEASLAMDNSHITISTKTLEGSGNLPCDEFNLYRWGQVLDQIYTDDSYTAETYQGDYKTGGAATKTETSSGSHIWNTNWFYENNKTAYHFRTLNDLAAGKNGSGVVDGSNISNTTDSNPVSSFKMEGGSVDTHDYHWGAPMKTGMDASEFLKYDIADGYKSSIHKGIIAPKNNESNTINITELHMMSNIYVSLQTTTGTNKVDLTGAKVRLTQLSLNATVDMGIGLITPNSQTDAEHWASVYQEMSTPSSYWLSENTKTDYFSCAAIPQALVRSATPNATDYVGITITADGNEYYVVKELSDLTATSVSGGHNVVENEEIKRWYPGHKYYYTFTITKKGIENITCVLTDWVTVTATDKDINLEG